MAVSSKKTAAPKMRRADKVAQNRRALLRAGAEVVGERGYEEASIAQITDRAGLGHGTFYKHFPSRQAMFDELLPSVGHDLIDYVGEVVRGSKDIVELEEKGFRAFFQFLSGNPGFYRLLNEAETSAPQAFEKHIKTLARHYVKSLGRSRRRNEIAEFEDRDLEVIAYILMAARFYLYLRFSKSGTKAKPVPEWVVSSYVKFISYGLLGRPPQ